MSILDTQKHELVLTLSTLFLSGTVNGSTSEMLNHYHWALAGIGLMCQRTVLYDDACCNSSRARALTYVAHDKWLACNVQGPAGMQSH